jgi:isorenieratene synthase
MTGALTALGLLTLIAAVGWGLRWRALPPEDRDLLGLRPSLVRWIERRLGGWRHDFNQPDPAAPERLEAPRRVAVIGGGLAGIGAAALLAERGFEVTLLEKNDYLGGKVGAWKEALTDGSEATVEHGYHAFFPHYYNLNHFLERLDILQRMERISDYLILARDGRRHGFQHTERVPVLNILALGRQGVFRWREVLFGPTPKHMDAFLRYHPEQTFAQLDEVSFADFARMAKLPPGLMLSFNTFARAFFAEEDHLSMAELVKSFHFYYLSQPGGLLYDYPVADYEEAVVGPLRAYLEGLGAEVRLGRGVEGIERDGEGFVIGGERYDAAVLACDVVGARKIAGGSAFLDAEAPEAARKLKAIRPSQRYAVLRIWTDRDLPEDVPVFVITERLNVLDAVATYHRFEPDCAAWVAQRGGAVLELHSYAVPDEIVEEGAIRQLMLEELEHFFPGMRGHRIVREHLQVNRNFAAFHVGMHADRPETATGVPGLYLAGDWVKLPLPVMLMEAAYTAGVLAANGVLREHGLREQQVWSVPPRGVLDGVPQPPWSK